MSETLTKKTTTATDFTHKVSVIEKDFTMGIVDRCDRCSSQAYVKVKMVNDGELLFCAHHYKAQAGNLLPLSAVLNVRDESAHLLWKAPITE